MTVEALISFEISPDDGGPYRVDAYSRDVLLWEKAVKGRSFSQMQSALAMVDLYGLAHVAARRQGLFAGTLQEFEATCDLEPVTDEAPPDPTRSGATPAL